MSGYWFNHEHTKGSRKYVSKEGFKCVMVHLSCYLKIKTCVSSQFFVVTVRKPGSSLMSLLAALALTTAHFRSASAEFRSTTQTDFKPALLSIKAFLWMKNFAFLKFHYSFASLILMNSQSSLKCCISKEALLLNRKYKTWILFHFTKCETSE